VHILAVSIISWYSLKFTNTPWECIHFVSPLGKIKHTKVKRSV